LSHPILDGNGVRAMQLFVLNVRRENAGSPIDHTEKQNKKKVLMVENLAHYIHLRNDLLSEVCFWQ
jgi:hypothetical protein